MTAPERSRGNLTNSHHSPVSTKAPGGNFRQEISAEQKLTVTLAYTGTSRSLRCGCKRRDGFSFSAEGHTRWPVPSFQVADNFKKDPKWMRIRLEGPKLVSIVPGILNQTNQDCLQVFYLFPWQPPQFDSETGAWSCNARTAMSLFNWSFSCSNFSENNRFPNIQKKIVVLQKKRKEKRVLVRCQNKGKKL